MGVATVFALGFEVLKFIAVKIVNTLKKGDVPHIALFLYALI